jgi:hypothetical protein
MDSDGTADSAVPEIKDSPSLTDEATNFSHSCTYMLPVVGKYIL